MTSTYLPGYLPDAGKGSAVCSCSALWDPLPCSSPSTPNCLGAPFGRGTFPGGQVRFLGDFGVLVYPPSDVPRQSHCTLALLSIGDVARPLHFLTIALPAPGRARLKKTKQNKKKLYKILTLCIVR